MPRQVQLKRRDVGKVIDVVFANLLDLISFDCTVVNKIGHDCQLVEIRFRLHAEVAVFLDEQATLFQAEKGLAEFPTLWKDQDAFRQQV